MARSIVTTIPDSGIQAKSAEDNPCVRNCCLDDGNVCLGCGRKLAEILEWHHADPERRGQILQSASHRIAQRESV